jgi:hypothetical protein
MLSSQATVSDVELVDEDLDLEELGGQENRPGVDLRSEWLVLCVYPIYSGLS